MEAVKFIEEWVRMCKTIKNCNECDIRRIKSDGNCRLKIESNPEEAVAIVQKWSAEHTIKTRQSEFLNMFPNAPLRENGSIAICPLDVDRYAKCSEKQGARCPDCQKEYWLAEVK